LRQRPLDPRVNFAWMSCAKSCIVLQKTQRASSELIDSSTTASAKSELKILVSAVQFRPWPPLLQYLTHGFSPLLGAAREFRVTSRPR
jgi:hypothetical protein